MKNRLEFIVVKNSKFNSIVKIMQEQTKNSIFGYYL